MSNKDILIKLVEKADERQTQLIFSFVENLVGKHENIVETTDRLCDVFFDISIKAWKARGLLNYASETEDLDRASENYNALIDSVIDYVFAIETITNQLEKKCCVYYRI